MTRPTAVAPVAPSVGYYFAGLADGEGHFAIRKSTKRGWSCLFILKLRADDRELLEWLQDATGLGRIYINRARPTPGRNNNPAYQWHVATKVDCLALCEIFRAYPLRSRKAEEFKVWDYAVRYWNDLTYVAGVNRRGHREPLADWRPLEMAAGSIKQLRQYREAVPA